MSTECYQTYLRKVESSIPTDMRTFWSFSKLHRPSGTTAKSMRLDNELVDEPIEKCKLFAQFFSSVYSLPSKLPCNHIFRNIETWSSCCFTTDEVRRKLNNLDPAKSCGPDGIPASVLRHCSDQLALPITSLYNLSLSTGVFPDIFKLGVVVPIHKSGDQADVRNYRPITLLSAIAKVFESLLLDKMSNFFRSIIPQSQHGFLPGRSVTSNLVLFQEYIQEAFSRKNQVDAIYIDFSKAFDRVDHRILLSKLRGYGITGPLHDWFTSYLTDRRLTVRYDSAYSEEFVSSSGVPQGSHLGPYLFNVFTSDVASSLSSNTLLFADDMKMFLEVESESDCVTLQDQIRKLEDWCLENAMTINTAKSHTVSFSRTRNTLNYRYILQNQAIERVSIIRDLGILLEPDLSRGAQVREVISRSNRLLGFVIRSTRGITSTKALKAIYCSTVRPILEFSSVAWSPYQVGHINELERVQNRFIRMVGVRQGMRYREVPVQEMAVDMGLMRLENRRRTQDGVFLFKLLTGGVDCPELLRRVNIRVPQRTRSQELFERTHQSTLFSQNCAMTRLQRLGCDISREVDFFTMKLPAIKKTLNEMSDIRL